jgi:hypothetical protein
MPDVVIKTSLTGCSGEADPWQDTALRASLIHERNVSRRPEEVKQMAGPGLRSPGGVRAAQASRGRARQKVESGWLRVE